MIKRRRGLGTISAAPTIAAAESST